MAHITLQQLTTALQRIVSWAGGKFAAKNTVSGKLDYADMPVVVLASMGAELDGTSTGNQMSAGSTYFAPAGPGISARINLLTSSGQHIKISDPESNVIYCNAYTGLLYRWDSTTSRMVPVGGDGNGLREVYVSGSDFSSLDTLYSNESSGVYQVIDQSTQMNIGILVVSCDNYHASVPHFVTQWLFSNLVLSGDTGGYSGSIDGTHYMSGKAHIVHRFYNVSAPVSGENDIPLNTWSEWKVYGLTLDEIAELLNTKANSSDLANYATKSELTSGLSGKQDTLTFDTTPTAGHTTQVMSSDKIKTALDNLLTNLHIVNNEWYIGNTPTGVSAQGPAGNVNISDASQLVTILVNDLITGGAGNILTAEMGKVLKTAITTLLDSMGEYCFPLGRPTLSFEGPKCDVTQNLTDVDSDFSALRVDEGGSLEITLTPSDNLHVFLTGDVTVEMPLGNDITSTAWNENTGKVTIAEVTDDVVITAKSSTYVQNGLVSMFDGKNVDWQNHQWVDLVDNSRVLKMNTSMSAPASGDHVEFDGVEDSTYAVAESTTTKVNVADTTGTIEAVLKGITCNSTSGDTGRLFFRQALYTENGTRKPLICANIMYSSLFNNSIGIGCLQAASGRTYPNVWLTGKSAITPSEFLCFSVSNTRAYLGGQKPALTRASGSVATIYTGTNDYITLGVMSWLKEAGDFSTAHKGSTAGSAYCVRVYGRALEEYEVLYNYKIDKKRFNLA